MDDLSGRIKFLVKSIIRVALCSVASVISLFIKPLRSQIPPIEDRVLLKRATQLSADIKSGKLTSVQLLECYIKRIKQVNPYVNAVADEHYDQAIKRAHEIDQRLARARQDPSIQEPLMASPLAGVPMTVKETVGLEGSSLTGGIISRATKVAARSNPAVSQLIDAGLIPLASTNTSCMNLWWDAYNLVRGRTCNPYDLSRIPGGSSGGEAALQAAAGSVVGVGSDLAGSIRIPANFCGIFGHKPTPSLISTEHLYPAGSVTNKLRATGPMCRYAADLKPMMQLMLNKGAEKELNLDEPVSWSDLNIFYCLDMGDPLELASNHQVGSSVRAAAQHLASKTGRQAVEVKLDEFKYGLPLWSAELDADAVKYAPEDPNGRTRFSPAIELFKSILGTSEFPYTAILHHITEKFSAKQGSDKQKHLRRRAQELRQRFNNLVGDNGILLMPCHPEPAPHHLTTAFKFLNCGYTAVGNVLHAPITQIPLGQSRDGLPIGIQAIAAPLKDRICLAVALELEQAFGGWISPSRIN